jgi:hypothetical protein
MTSCSSSAWHMERSRKFAARSLDREPGAVMGVRGVAVHRATSATGFWYPCDD